MSTDIMIFIVRMTRMSVSARRVLTERRAKTKLATTSVNARKVGRTSSLTSECEILIKTKGNYLFVVRLLGQSI